MPPQGVVVICPASGNLQIDSTLQIPAKKELYRVKESSS